MAVSVSSTLGPWRPPPFVVGDAVEARLRGKSHWYPATVVRVDVEGTEDKEWRFSISYTDGFRDLHYPPPAPPLMEKGVEPKEMRLLREHECLTECYTQLGGTGTGKKGWDRKVGWNRKAVADMPRDARPFYEDIVQWDGVTCTDGRLSHLHLEGNRLQGHVPHTVWKLDYLLELNLSSNKLAGPLPAQISGLRSCTWLDLSNNNLSGRIPRAIGGCAKLQVLDLSNNDLAGPVPTTLARLLDLRECRLEDNKLTGTLPATFVESLKFCEDLRLLDLSDNPGITDFDAFRDGLRGYLPNCSIFVGCPRLEPMLTIQDFGAHVDQKLSPTPLKHLNEDDWEAEFDPPW